VNSVGTRHERVNGPLKSSTKPRMFASSFYHLFFLIRFLTSDIHECSIRFVKLFITTHLHIHQSRAEPHHIYYKLCQSVRGLQEYTVIEEVMHVLNYLIMSYILNILICIGMILLDNML
jgi:hypothetical protein